MTMHLENPGLTTNNTKKRKASKKAQQAQKKHDEWLRSQGIHKDQIAERNEKRRQLESKKKAKTEKRSHVGFADADKSSLAGVAAKREAQVYNGERKLVGIATMHKSNMVPVFEDRKEDAKDIANMRRN